MNLTFCWGRAVPPEYDDPPWHRRRRRRNDGARFKRERMLINGVEGLGTTRADVAHTRFIPLLLLHFGLWGWRIEERPNIRIGVNGALSTERCLVLSELLWKKQCGKLRR